MVTEWKPVKLDQLGFVGRGKSRHRPRNAAFLYDGPYPFFQTGDIKAASLHLTEYSQTYSEAGLAQSKLWKPGALCITIAANIAETAILGIEGCFPDSLVGFIADPEKSDEAGGGASPEMFASKGSAASSRSRPGVNTRVARGAGFCA